MEGPVGCVGLRGAEREEGVLTCRTASNVHAKLRRLGMNASRGILKMGMPLITAKGGELGGQCAFMMGSTTAFKSSS